MTKKMHKANAVSSDKLFVIGLDDSGKPRGARFAECDDRVVNAALDMRLSCIHPASTVFAELAMKLPQGRLYASGKTFIPNIRRDLYDKLTVNRSSIFVTDCADDSAERVGIFTSSFTAESCHDPHAAL